MNLQPKERASALPSVHHSVSMLIGAFIRGLVRQTFCADLSLVLQIALVAHDDDGEVVLVLNPQYLLLECDDLLEALSRRYAVDQEKAFTSPHVLLSHG